MPHIATPYLVDSPLERGIEGCGISREDALALMNDAPLGALLQAAGAVRDRFKGRAVSYSRKVFIPLTHLCRDYCGYFNFPSAPRAGGAPYITPPHLWAA